MIYTVTLNPSLDYIVDVPDFQLGITNRTKAEQVFPGGKGINVSMVLKNLGYESKTLGFLSGFVGHEIQSLLEHREIHPQFIWIENENSRINIKLKNIEGTEINGKGPNISETHIKQLLQQLDTLCEGDILVLAGSIPSSLPTTIYMDIMKRLEQKKVEVVVDATKELLLNVLAYHPFLIKPNHHELGEMFGVKIQDKTEVLKYARKLQEKGAKNVLVSMGVEGAVFLAQDETYYLLEAPKGKLVNAVGAGDSMVAGFLAGWLEHKQFDHAFKMSVATGSASAFSENLATKEEALNLYTIISKPVNSGLEIPRAYYKN